MSVASTRARLAAIHADLRAGVRDAPARVRDYLHDDDWREARAADLRYLVLVLQDAGLLRVGSTYALIAGVVQELAPLYDRPAAAPDAMPVNDEDDEDAGDSEDGSVSPSDLEGACRFIEGGATSLGAVRWDPTRVRSPAQRLVRTVARQLVRGRDPVVVLRFSTHAVARLRSAGLAPAARAEVRAAIYRRLVDHVVLTLTPSEQGTSHRLGLVHLLVDLGMIQLAHPAGSPTALANELAPLLRRPVGERANALEAILLQSDQVDDVYADLDELTELLAEWG